MNGESTDAPNIPCILPEVDTFTNGISPTLRRALKLQRWDFLTDNGFPNDGTLRYSLFWIADCTFNYIAARRDWQSEFEGDESLFALKLINNAGNFRFDGNTTDRSGKQINDEMYLLRSCLL